jgi:hypothetical protein
VPHSDPDSTDEDVRSGDDQGGLRGRLESLLPHILRKTVTSGGGARQLTEDVVRGAIGDMKLPKEAVHYIIDLADNTKREVVRVAAREFREFLDSARFHEELGRILTQLSLEIKTEIRFVPNEDALKPRVSSSATLKNRADGGGGAELEATESVNEAVRSGATELAEMLLQRMFKAPLPPDDEKPSDTAEAPAAKDTGKTEAAEEVAEADGVEAEEEQAPQLAAKPKKKAAPRKRTTATKKRTPKAGAKSTDNE